MLYMIVVMVEMSFIHAAGVLSDSAVAMLRSNTAHSNAIPIGNKVAGGDSFDFIHHATSIKASSSSGR